MSAKLIQVIVTDIERRGEGRDKSDPVRRVTQYWSTDGELLAEVDPFAEEREAGRREGLELARLAVEKCASVHRMRMQSFADDSDRVDSEAVEDDIAIEEVKAEAVEYAASRIRALAEPRTKGEG